eukprot:1157868-Karenia_brevis.AAC.1
MDTAPQARMKESAAHRRARKQREDDRLIARLSAAHNKLATHHGSTLPPGFAGSHIASDLHRSSQLQKHFSLR